MPIVGIDSSSVTRAATGAGTASRTSAKHPAASSARASAYSRRAFSAVRPCALKPPSIVADCGVRPTCPMTGPPASTIGRTRGSGAPAHARAPRFDARAHPGQRRAGPLELYVMRAGFLREADRVAERLLVADL